jgi:hypothetical protein
MSLIPCHVTVRPSDGVVSVRELVAVADGVAALVDGEGYERIGQVWQVDIHHKGVPMKRWMWAYDRPGGESWSSPAKSRKDGVAQLLLFAGYRQAEENEASVPLFSLVTPPTPKPTTGRRQMS